MIIRWIFDYLIIMIRDYFMIQFPHQQQVGWFASFPKAFAWNSGTSWWWQPFTWAYCSMQVSPASTAATCCRSHTWVCNNNLIFHGGFDPPSAPPRSSRRIVLQEKFNPAITENLKICDGMMRRHPAPRSWIYVFTMESRLFIHTLSEVPLQPKYWKKSQ